MGKHEQTNTRSQVTYQHKFRCFVGLSESSSCSNIQGFHPWFYRHKNSSLQHYRDPNLKKCTSLIFKQIYEMISIQNQYRIIITWNALLLHYSKNFNSIITSIYVKLIIIPYEIQSWSNLSLQAECYQWLYDTCAYLGHRCAGHRPGGSPCDTDRRSCPGCPHRSVGSRHSSKYTRLDLKWNSSLKYLKHKWNSLLEYLKHSKN